MRGISYSTFFLLVVFFSLAAVAVLMVRETLRRRKNYWEMGGSKLFECKNCHYSFVSQNEANVSRCPRCNSICFRRSRK